MNCNDSIRGWCDRHTRPFSDCDNETKAENVRLLNQIANLREIGRINGELRSALEIAFPSMIHTYSGHDDPSVWVDGCGKCRAAQLLTNPLNSKIDTCESVRQGSGELVGKFCSTYESSKYPAHSLTCQFGKKLNHVPPKDCEHSACTCDFCKKNPICIHCDRIIGRMS